MKAGKYILHNEEKVYRAINGTDFIVKGVNIHTGGIKKEDGSYDDEALLAEYDKLGGHITKNNDRIKMGSFYDFGNKKPRVEPEITFVYNVNGEFIEVKEGQTTPGIIEAVKIVEKQKKERVIKKKK